MLDVIGNLHTFCTPALHGCSVQFSASANTLFNNADSLAENYTLLNMMDDDDSDQQVGFWRRQSWLISWY